MQKQSLLSKRINIIEEYKTKIPPLQSPFPEFPSIRMFIFLDLSYTIKVILDIYVYDYFIILQISNTFVLYLACLHSLYCRHLSVLVHVDGATLFV